MRVRLTTVEVQSKQARSKLQHQASNQYAGSILETCCCVRCYHIRYMW